MYTLIENQPYYVKDEKYYKVSVCEDSVKVDFSKAEKIKESVKRRYTLAELLKVYTPEQRIEETDEKDKEEE